MVSKFSFSQPLSAFDFYNPYRAGIDVAISANSNLSASLVAIRKGSVSLDSESSGSFSGLRVVTGSSSIDSTVVTVATLTEILISPQLSLSSSADIVSTGFIRFSNSITEDTQSIRTLIVIDENPISEHNRTFSESINHSFAEVSNWNSRKTRYYKTSSGRKTFSLSWTYLPGQKNFTVDSRHGRDKINEISKDPDVHVLKIRNIDTNGTTPYTETEYNVLVKSYTETLLRRDLNQNIFLWDCNIELEEI